MQIIVKFIFYSIGIDTKENFNINAKLNIFENKKFNNENNNISSRNNFFENNTPKNSENTPTNSMNPNNILNITSNNFNHYKKRKQEENNTNNFVSNSNFFYNPDYNSSKINLDAIKFNFEYNEENLKNSEIDQSLLADSLDNFKILIQKNKFKKNEMINKDMSIDSKNYEKSENPIINLIKKDKKKNKINTKLNIDFLNLNRFDKIKNNIINTSNIINKTILSPLTKTPEKKFLRKINNSYLCYSRSNNLNDNSIFSTIEAEKNKSPINLKNNSDNVEYFEDLSFKIKNLNNSNIKIRLNTTLEKKNNSEFKNDDKNSNNQVLIIRKQNRKKNVNNFNKKNDTKKNNLCSSFNFIKNLNVNKNNNNQYTENIDDFINNGGETNLLLNKDENYNNYLKDLSVNNLNEENYSSNILTQQNFIKDDKIKKNLLINKLKNISNINIASIPKNRIKRNKSSIFSILKVNKSSNNLNSNNLNSNYNFNKNENISNLINKNCKSKLTNLSFGYLSNQTNSNKSFLRRQKKFSVLSQDSILPTLEKFEIDEVIVLYFSIF